MIEFELHYFQGCTCTGCPVIEDLVINVPFTQPEIDLMHQLVSSIDEDDADYSQGCPYSASPPPSSMNA